MNGKGGRPPKSKAQNEYNRLTGARIEMARKEAGVSARDLARAIGVHRSQLYWYESGRSGCSFLILTRVARKLNIPLAALLPVSNNSGIVLQKKK